eukprot:3555559-Pyramimonas_sp.AAC.1
MSDLAMSAQPSSRNTETEVHGNRTAGARSAHEEHANKQTHTRCMSHTILHASAHIGTPLTADQN